MGWQYPRVRDPSRETDLVQAAVDAVDAVEVDLARIIRHAWPVSIHQIKALDISTWRISLLTPAENNISVHEIPEDLRRDFARDYLAYLRCTGNAELADDLSRKMSFVYLRDHSSASPCRANIEPATWGRGPADKPSPIKETIAMASADPAPPAPKTAACRLKDAIREGAKRAPVELALEKGQALLVKQLLAGFRGSRTDKAAARKFLLWFFSTPAGQVAIAGVISTGAPLVADFLGKGRSTAQAVADEFAARAATIATREGTKFALKHLQPAMSLFVGLFDAMAAEVPVLDQGKGGAIVDLGLERERVAAG